MNATCGPYAFRIHCWRARAPSRKHGLFIHKITIGFTCMGGQWRRRGGSKHTAMTIATLTRQTSHCPSIRSSSPICSGAEFIHSRLNGQLLNRYDGALRHYIGRRRDSRKGLVPDSPIVTTSLGESRIFRLRPWRGQGRVDLEASDGAVFITPWKTNCLWTH